MSPIFAISVVQKNSMYELASSELHSTNFGFVKNNTFFSFVVSFSIVCFNSVYLRDIKNGIVWQTFQGP